MYVIILVAVVLFAIITIIYYKDRNKIIKELNKIEKENGTAKRKLKR